MSTTSSDDEQSSSSMSFETAAVVSDNEGLIPPFSDLSLSENSLSELSLSETQPCIQSWGEFFVSRPLPGDGKHLLGGRGVGKPRGRAAGPYVVSRPSLRQTPTTYLLGRPQNHCCSSSQIVECEAKEYSGPGVYVLQKEDGSFYVGKSLNVAERLKQHANGTGASCAHGSVRRVPTTTSPIVDDLEAWERAETLTRMRHFGISRVRGWMYTTPKLSDSQREHAFQQVCEKHDLCRKCGNAGHFAAKCKVIVSVANRPAWAR